MSVSQPAPALGNVPPAVPEKDDSSTSFTPDVDLVLVFEARDAKLIKAKKEPSQSEKNERLEEYSNLIKAIRSVGLQVTARPSCRIESDLLLFVRAPDQTLVASGKLENLNDYLHGVKSAVEPAKVNSFKRTSSMTRQGIQDQAQQFSPAERVRFAYDLLTRPKPHGANIGIKSKEFPHLKDMTPIHNPDYNHDWLIRWSSIRSGLQIKITELDSVRAHFGEHIALYYGFLNFYFQSLASIAITGFAFWTAGATFHPVYSLLLVVWSCIFVEVWRMKEKKLAVRWGTSGVGRVDARRNEFHPRIVRKDPATGENQEVFEWWRREIRIALSVPVMVFFVALLGATMTTIFVTEVFIGKLYSGPGKNFFHFVPTALFSICVPQIMAAWQATASALTSWENHYSVRKHQASLTLKMFALQGVVAYGALTLSAFVYIPFGQHIMNLIVQHGFFSSSLDAASARGDIKRSLNGEVTFDIDPSRMHAQLFAVLTTSQVINTFTETALPFIMHKFNEYREDKKNGKSKKMAEKSVEAKFLHRVEEELTLPNYDTFGDYAEMATQFGYIVLWSIIWPLAPVMGFINNFFELRSDAIKMTVNARRPVPVRAESIGPWLEVLGFLAWLAAMLNAALIYLFQPSPNAHLPGHSPYETVLRTHLHSSGALNMGVTDGQTPGKIIDSIVYPSDPAHSARSPLSFSRLLPSSLPISGITGALTASLLLALAAEHVYGMLRGVVRHILDRALWRGSEEETILRKREFQQRKEALERSGMGEAAVDALKAAAPSHIGAPENGQNVFWREPLEEGKLLIEQSGKSE